MNELANVNDRRMKVSEVAEALGVTDGAIKKHVREMYPDLMRNGFNTYLNEEQITTIKQKMLSTTQVVGAITDIEAMQMLARAGEHLKARYEQEQRARIEAENNVARLESKIEADEDKVRLYKTCMESNGWQSISDVAKKLNRPGLGPNNLHKFLLREKVLFRNSRGYNVPYQGYIDRGYFRVGQKPRPDSRIVDDFTLVSQGGFAFIERLANGAFPLLALA